MPDREKIGQLLHTQEFGRVIYCLDKVDSTNDTMKKLAKLYKNGYVLIADEQTAGRGTKGRIWHSGKGDSLLMSILIKPVDILKSPVITLLSGLAVAKALNGLCGDGFRIKWPNDIVYDGKKVCGILCEGWFLKPDSLIVCGIGVNLTQEKSFFVQNGLRYAASVQMLTGKTPTKEEVAAAILNEFDDLFAKYRVKEAYGFLEEYQSLCVTLGRMVKTEYKGKLITGIGAEINPTGALVIKRSGDFITVESGEVSVTGVMDS